MLWWMLGVAAYVAIGILVARGVDWYSKMPDDGVYLFVAVAWPMVAAFVALAAPFCVVGWFIMSTRRRPSEEA